MESARQVTQTDRRWHEYMGAFNGSYDLSRAFADPAWLITEHENVTEWSSDAFGTYEVYTLYETAYPATPRPRKLYNDAFFAQFTGFTKFLVFLTDKKNLSDEELKKIYTFFHHARGFTGQILSCEEIEENAKLFKGYIDDFSKDGNYNLDLDLMICGTFVEGDHLVDGILDNTEPHTSDEVAKALQQVQEREKMLDVETAGARARAEAAAAEAAAADKAAAEKATAAEKAAGAEKAATALEGQGDDNCEPKPLREDTGHEATKILGIEAYQMQGFGVNVICRTSSVKYGQFRILTPAESGFDVHQPGDARLISSTSKYRRLGALMLMQGIERTRELMKARNNYLGLIGVAYRKKLEGCLRKFKEDYFDRQTQKTGRMPQCLVLVRWSDLGHSTWETYSDLRTMTGNGARKHIYNVLKHFDHLYNKIQRKDTEYEQRRANQHRQRSPSLPLPPTEYITYDQDIRSSSNSRRRNRYKSKPRSIRESSIEIEDEDESSDEDDDHRRVKFD